jgi:acetyltransferase
MDKVTIGNSARRRSLDVFFNAKNVAVIGATGAPHSVGRSIVANLKDAPFPGAIYPVNPRDDTLLGLRCFPSIWTVPDAVDLAVIVTPAKTVPGVIRECASSGVPAAIIISGFREIGERGAALEREILEAARHEGMCIVGPNCLGLMSPHHMLNATFASTMLARAILDSLAKAVLCALLSWSRREMVGF